jgi:hypothetical protein
MSPAEVFIVGIALVAVMIGLLTLRAGRKRQSGSR